MLQIFTLITLIFADSESALQDFVNSEVTITIDEEDTVEYEGENIEGEVALLLEEVEPEMDPSFEGEVARESAKILSEEMVMDEDLEQLVPTYEDLQELVSAPPVTMASEELNPYEKLPVSVDEKVKIGKLLMTLAENSVVKLLFERKRLESWGHDINHLHPIRFLGTIFTNPRLIHCMRRIKTSSFKWDAFIEGFAKRFNQELKINNVNAYLPGFAESVGVELAPLQHYADKKDFEGMVLYLMKEKSR